MLYPEYAFEKNCSMKLREFDNIDDDTPSPAKKRMA